ncbi:MAG: DUF5711 family protein [Eubacteriales bacterium]
MQRKSVVRIANIRRFVLSLIILFSIGILIVGIYYFASSRNTLDRDFTPANITEDTQYCLLDDFYIVLDGNTLSNYTYDGEMLWSKIVYSDSLVLSASEKLVVIYSNKSFQALTTEGEYLYSTDVIGSVNRIICGNNVIAVFSEIIEEDNTSENMVYFYNPTGNLFDSISFAPQIIVDIGFTSSDSLWVLTNDPTGVIPTSRVITYNPGVSMTGLTTLYSELVEKVYFSGDYMYIVTTTNLLKYDLFGEELSSNMIYDWQVESTAFDTAEDYFVTVPRAQQNDKYFANARILTAIDYHKVNLPSNVNGLLMQGNRLYVFGEDIIYIYSETGEYLRQYQLKDDISFIANAADNRVLVLSQGTYYFLALP